MKIQDTLLVALGDTHCGSPLGLIRYKQWDLKGVNATPNEFQKILWNHFDESAKHIKKISKGRRLIIVHNGDAIEGIHHNNRQVMTLYENLHKEIHVDAMDHFLKKSGFNRKRGDELFYVDGTPSHVNESEDAIAKDLKAKKVPILKLNVNGVRFLFIHHGASPGQPKSKGTSLRNKIHGLAIQNSFRGKPIPRYVIYSHKHTKTHSSFEDEGVLVDGFILPAYQGKTEFAYKVVPDANTDIGMLLFDIKATGDSTWDWRTLEVDQDEEIRL